MLKNERWDKISFKFIRFVNIALIVLIGMILVTTYDFLKRTNGKFGNMDIIFMGGSILIGLFCYFLYKKKMKSKKIVIILLIIGFILRIVWVLSINSIPVSDYNGIYRTTHEILQGDFSQLRGIGYYARFPHLTIPLLFASLMRLIFPINLYIAVKIVNCIFSSLGILFIYLLVKEIFKKDMYGLVGAFFMALYPPVILYTAVYCNENQAIPFYILGIYLFLKYINKDKKYIGVFGAGVALSVGNLFRMVGSIVVVAFILYIIVGVSLTFKERLKKGIIVILGFIIPLAIISFGLKAINFTEQHIWDGSEPKITNILKGTNIEGGGGWTHEDAMIPEIYNFDKSKIEEVCKEIILNRFKESSPKELLDFYYKKYTGIWSNGEFSGAYWAEHSLNDSEMIVRISQNGIWYIRLFYLILIAFTFLGLFNKESFKENMGINLIYFIFCGYGIMFLITERQDRYTFIMCWIFIILAMNGINLMNRLGVSKWKSSD